MVGFSEVLTGVLMVGSLAAPPDPVSIYGGELVEPCAWPTTVYVQGCTGTLVHPRLVVFAAHCIVYGGTPASVTFGEDPNAPEATVPTERCAAHPGWTGLPGEGRDFAYCVLAQAVEDMPIVPILMGCETDVLVPGAETTLVGHGMADDGQPELLKRQVITPITELNGDEIAIGSDGKSGCFGDSGGPAYIQLDDGTWRVFGVTSYGESNQCGFDGWYSMIHVGIDWFEEESGIDLTPCHDAAGTWEPTEACGGFPLEPDATDFTWAQACNGGSMSGFSATCGEPFAEAGTTGGEEETGDSGSSGDGPQSEDGSSSDSSTSSAEDGTGDASTPPPDDGMAGGGDGEGDRGCGCRSASRDPGLALLILLGLVARRRRRPLAAIASIARTRPGCSPARRRSRPSS